MRLHLLAHLAHLRTESVPKLIDAFDEWLKVDPRLRDEVKRVIGMRHNASLLYCKFISARFAFVAAEHYSLRLLCFSSLHTRFCLVLTILRITPSCVAARQVCRLLRRFLCARRSLTLFLYGSGACNLRHSIGDQLCKLCLLPSARSGP